MIEVDILEIVYTNNFGSLRLHVTKVQQLLQGCVQCWFTVVGSKIL